MIETGFRVLLVSWTLLVASACGAGSELAPGVSDRENARPRQASPNRPNVLLFSLDTFRADRIDRAPFLSELASRGLTAPQTWSSSNWTLPSHMSLMTSTYPIEHDTPSTGARMPYTGEGVRPGMTTLAEAYRAAGYATAASTDGGFVGAGFGFENGFDQYVSATENEAAGSFDHHLRVLEDLLKNREGRPFFFFLHTYKIHDYFLNTPAYHDFVDPDADREYIEHGSWLEEIKQGSAPADYVSRLYDSAIRETDAFVKEIVEKVEEATAGEDLLVVMTSDHGESFGARPGLWHHGNGLWEEQLRVPLVVWGNYDHAPKGRFAQPVSLVDVAPSLLSASGVDIPEGFRGRSDVFTRSLVSEMEPEMRDRVIQASRVHTGSGLAQSHVSHALIQSGWKYLREDSFAGKTRLEKCFDLRSDPGEMDDKLASSSSPCSRFPELLARRLQESVQRALFVRGNPGSRIQLDLSDADQVMAVRTASGSRSGIVSPGTGSFSWVPQSRLDVLTIIFRETPSSTIHLRVNGQTLEDALAWSRIGTVDAPTKLGSEADSLTLFRSLGADPVEVVGEVDEDLIRRLRALGYSE